MDELTERFIASLEDETDQTIVRLRLQEKAQTEIATALGFASQATVVKRLKKIKAKFEAFLNDPI